MEQGIAGAALVVIALTLGNLRAKAIALGMDFAIGLIFIVFFLKSNSDGDFRFKATESSIVVAQLTLIVQLNEREDLIPSSELVWILCLLVLVVNAEPSDRLFVFGLLLLLSFVYYCVGSVPLT